VNSALAADSIAPRSRRLRRFLRSPSALFACGLLVLIVLVAIFADMLAPLSPSTTNLRATLQPPGSAGHLLGTDQLGRDVLSRLIFGTRISVIAGLGATALSLFIALPIGLFSGYVGGRVDWLVQRAIEVMLSIPPLVLVLVIAGILGPNVQNSIIALGAFFIPAFTRLIRSEVANVAVGPLVEAERALGLHPVRIALRHVLPSVAPAIVVEVSLAMGVAIVAEASLAFLGLGAPPPAASWGGMIRDGLDVIQTATWLVVIPCCAIAVTVLAVNLLGDALRDAMGRIDR
jgi:ABC-type dipeptide/oligopeptide/nickel transport system permease subunit